MSKESKQHELLAVRADIKKIFDKILAESKRAFQSKQENFTGELKTLTVYNDEENTKMIELGADVVNNKPLTTTVAKRLNYNASFINKYIDVLLQQEATNQTACADIIIDDTALVLDVPATFLLSLETNLKAVRELFDFIPTLAPGKEWVLDPDAGDGAYKTKDPDKSFKTKSVTTPVVFYEATKEHPAQVKEVAETKNTGVYSSQLTSGMMSPADKSALIGRTDKLIQAVKTARRRANDVKVVKRTCGAELMNFILGK